jgi:[CysO sulfur-carrier protein]-S-L-cysteine hydrolase
VIVSRDVIEHILAQAEEEAPIEACGFLFGLQGHITKDHPMTNADGREDHFSFDPSEHLAALRAASAEGLEIVGVYHSHPATPARPSAEDIRLANYPHIIYVIISLKDGLKTVKGFHIRDGEVKEELLILKGTAGQ